MSKLRVSAIAARGLDGKIIVLDSTQLSLGEFNRNDPTHRVLEEEKGKMGKVQAIDLDKNIISKDFSDSDLKVETRDKEKEVEEKSVEDSADDMII